MLEHSNKENLTVRQECHQLQEVMKETQVQLKEEMDKNHLLMEYPFKPTVDQSLTFIQSRRHINANSVRILLLEEQNEEIRQHYTPPLNKTSIKAKTSQVSLLL